jgi:hypothetical protein
MLLNSLVQFILVALLYNIFIFLYSVSVAARGNRALPITQPVGLVIISSVENYNNSPGIGLAQGKFSLIF